MICGCKPARFDLDNNAEWLPADPPVYYLASGDRASLMRIGLNGANPEAIATRGVRTFTFTKDGKRVAIVYEGQECGVVDLETLQETPIPGYCEEIEPNPEGTLYAVHGKGMLAAFHLATGDLLEVAKSPIGFIARWSVDSELYYREGVSDRWYSWEARSESTRFVSELHGDNLFWRQLGVERNHFNQHEAGYVFWLERVSPSGSQRAKLHEGSLSIESLTSSESRLVLQNKGGFNPDAGIHGFSSPSWSPDENYIVGEIQGDIVAVDVGSGRAAVIARGWHPTFRLDDYRVPATSNVHLGSYMWIRIGGY